MVMLIAHYGLVSVSAGNFSQPPNAFSMPALTNPTDIARETLRLLATRRVAPTPENYQRIYNELAGLPEDARKEWAAVLRELARHLGAVDTSKRKSESLDMFLKADLSDAQRPEKLLALVRSWGAPRAPIRQRSRSTSTTPGRSSTSTATDASTRSPTACC